MGKKYYCDYCYKTMVATPSIIRTHVKGVVHQKLVNEHYQQFKDAETILKEESVKNPCTRYPRGECQFGGVCRYLHYTKDELNELRKYVAAKNNKVYNQPSFKDLYQKLQDDKYTNSDTNDRNTAIFDANGVTHILPWNYNEALKNYDNLPPSIRKLEASDFENVYTTHWG